MAATMTTKPGFMLYFGDLEMLLELDDQTLRRFLKAMGEYAKNGTEPNFTGLEKIGFATFKASLDRDSENYRKRVEAGSKGGKKSGESRRNKRDAQASPCDEYENETEPQKAEVVQTAEGDELPWAEVPPPVQPLEVVQGNSDAAGERGCEKFPPTIEMVTQYVKARGLQVDVKQFLSVNKESGWKDSNGKPIRNWRVWLEGWAQLHPLKQRGRCGSGIPTALNYSQRTYQEGELDYLFTDPSQYMENGAEAAR